MLKKPTWCAKPTVIIIVAHQQCSVFLFLFDSTYLVARDFPRITLSKTIKLYSMVTSNVTPLISAISDKFSQHITMLLIDCTSFSRLIHFLKDSSIDYGGNVGNVDSSQIMFLLGLLFINLRVTCLFVIVGNKFLFCLIDSSVGVTGIFLFNDIKQYRHLK